jgi:hypothetical protein
MYKCIKRNIKVARYREEGKRRLPAGPRRPLAFSASSEAHPSVERKTVQAGGCGLIGEGSGGEEKCINV